MGLQVLVMTSGAGAPRTDQVLRSMRAYLDAPDQQRLQDDLRAVLPMTVVGCHLEALCSSEVQAAA